MNLPSEIREGSRRWRELVGIHVYEYREKAKGYANSVRFLKPRQLAKVCDFGVILCLTATARKSMTKGKTLSGERSSGGITSSGRPPAQLPGWDLSLSQPASVPRGWTPARLLLPSAMDQCSISPSSLLIPQSSTPHTGPQAEPPYTFTLYSISSFGEKNLWTNHFTSWVRMWFIIQGETLLTVKGDAIRIILGQ